MEIKRAETMAKDLMAWYGLAGWTFKWMTSVRLFGHCSGTKMIIKLSSKLVSLNTETEVLNTILHEIAHALAPFDAGHDYRWRALAKDIGCTATRCYDNMVVTPGYRFLGTCLNCGYIIKRHRRSRISCGRCCPGGFNELRLFVWTLNKEGAN